jgi:methyl-accepting chemotaxis protein
VSEVVETMASINASSKKIVDIISVIDGIAFQANILAHERDLGSEPGAERGMRTVFRHPAPYLRNA